MNETMTDRELDAWIAEHLWDDARCSRCGRRFSYHPWDGSIDGTACLEPQPYAYSSTGEGMLMVLKAMRERGFGASIVAREEGDWWVMIATDHVMDWLTDDRAASSPSLPRAVAEAARAAIEAEA